MLAKRFGGEEGARSWVRALADRVAAAKDAEDAMREIADGIARDVDPYAFGVFLEDPGAHALVLHHRLAHGPLKDVPTAVHPEQGLVGFVFRHGVPLVVHDVARDPRYIRGPLADSMTALAVPIKAGRVDVRRLRRGGDPGPGLRARVRRRPGPRDPRAPAAMSGRGSLYKSIKSPTPHPRGV